jgi:hypothetical protein
MNGTPAGSAAADDLVSTLSAAKSAPNAGSAGDGGGGGGNARELFSEHPRAEAHGSPSQGSGASDNTQPVAVESDDDTHPCQ